MTVISSKRAELAGGGGGPGDREELHDDLLSAILTENKGGQSTGEAGGGTGTDDEALVDNLLTFFFAGFDTTSVALSFALYEIAARPDVEVSRRVGPRCTAATTSAVTSFGVSPLPTFTSSPQAAMPWPAAVVTATTLLHVVGVSVSGDGDGERHAGV